MVGLRSYGIYVYIIHICIYVYIIYVYIMYVCLHVRSLQSCLTPCDPMDCSPPGSSDHGILQARILGRVAMPSSRGSSSHRDLTHISCSSRIAGGFFTAEPPGKPHIMCGCVCMHILLMCHSPEFLMVQRSRSLILLSSA